MGSYDIKQKLDKHFQDNWSTTSIQYQDHPVSTTSLESFVSLVYAPVESVPYRFGGSGCDRIEYAGLFKVFCYARTTVKAMILADDVKTFLNRFQIDDVVVSIGQDRAATDLNNEFFEVLCTFPVSQWT